MNCRACAAFVPNPISDADRVVAALSVEKVPERVCAVGKTDYGRDYYGVWECEHEDRIRRREVSR